MGPGAGCYVCAFKLTPRSRRRSGLLTRGISASRLSPIVSRMLLLSMPVHLMRPFPLQVEMFVRKPRPSQSRAKPSQLRKPGVGVRSQLSGLESILIMAGFLFTGSRRAIGHRFMCCSVLDLRFYRWLHIASVIRHQRMHYRRLWNSSSVLLRSMFPTRCLRLRCMRLAIRCCKILCGVV